jgi:uncharacterized membrane protein
MYGIYKRSAPMSNGTTIHSEDISPPHARVLIVTFPDEAKIEQAIGALITAMREKQDIKIYRLATFARGLDGEISVQDVTEESHGTVGAGALIGGLTGLAAGPIGAAIGAGAGALIGWSAELANEEAVTEFASKNWSELAPGRRAIVAEVSDETIPRFRNLMASSGGAVAE